MRRITWTLAATAVAACSDGAGSPDAPIPDPDGPVAQADATPADATPPDAPVGLPACDDTLVFPIYLHCAGLYDDFEARTIAAGVREFKPGFQLWSDAAEKTRWIYLPAGSTIDVSDPIEWQFPIGTKLFKEFRVEVPGQGVRPVETRMLWKTGEATWVRRTYVWNEDMSLATEESDGIANVHGADYDIPRQIDCIRCHGGRVDNVLGFEHILLAAPEATGLTYQTLIDENLLTGPWWPTPEEVQVPGTTAERAALGYLHANCGVACHNPNIGGSRFDARLQHDTLANVAATQAYQQMINQPSTFQPTGATEPHYRIRPLDASRSAAHFRMNIRDLGAGTQQMPPVATNLVDVAGVGILEAWIAEMTEANGYPVAAP